MFKKAEKLGAKYALIVGEEELENGVLKIKNIATQEQQEISLENLQEELHDIFGCEEEHHCHCHDCDCDCEECGDEEHECHCHEEGCHCHHHDDE